MKYMGSKNRFAAEILGVVLANREPGQTYVEPFAGGMNLIDKVPGKRIANDMSGPLIEMWKALVYSDSLPPKKISKDIYKEVRTNKHDYPAFFVGWVGYVCSFRGKYFGGFAGTYPPKTKTSAPRDYQNDAIKNILRQVEPLRGVQFENRCYSELEILPNSLIYCDPPYFKTTEYDAAKDFDHGRFWAWVRQMEWSGHTVFVSEYTAPKDFVCVWEKETNSMLANSSKVFGYKNNVERLFRMDPLLK